jgi:hypothetical protein
MVGNLPTLEVVMKILVIGGGRELVGWVEQRDTHRSSLLGIVTLHPTYKMNTPA